MKLLLPLLLQFLWVKQKLNVKSYKYYYTVVLKTSIYNATYYTIFKTTVYIGKIGNSRLKLNIIFTTLDKKLMDMDMPFPIN